MPFEIKPHFNFSIITCFSSFLFPVFVSNWGQFNASTNYFRTSFFLVAFWLKHFVCNKKNKNCHLQSKFNLNCVFVCDFNFFPIFSSSVHFYFGFISLILCLMFLKHSEWLSPDCWLCMENIIYILRCVCVSLSLYVCMCRFFLLLLLLTVSFSWNWRDRRYNV